MKVSINTLRIGLSNSYQALFDYLDDTVMENLTSHEQTELAELTNQLRQDVGFINCTYDDSFEDDFDDLSERNEKLGHFGDEYF